MKLRHSKKETPEVNITPLIDVVFLLLIFFMVSTTFQREAELNIELPEASSQAPETQDQRIEIAIDASGRYFVNGRPLINRQPRTVREALKRASEGNESASLVISADADTPHQAVVTVMDAARQLGLVRLTFAARLGDKESE
ncbi:MAG TPA: biopolymer transporter ExbD [Gammaproteobacteria bacterium]|nr:biopolymer transporter ExbD [Gammaproteobacteria bacterium]